MTPYDSITNPPNYDAIEAERLEQRCKSGAYWFYWIAALSFITSLVSLSGSQWGFIVSLGVTQFVDALARAFSEQAGTAVTVIALLFDATAAAAFALIGYFASKKLEWVFVLGMVLYGLDGLIFLIAGDWLGIAFHAFALYGIFSGYRACTRLNAMQREQAPPPAAPSAA